MRTLVSFFNFRFAISLALIVFAFSLVWNSKSFNDRANEESKRADQTIQLLRDQQAASDLEWKNLKSVQHELYLRYQGLEKAQNALLQWLSVNHIVVPTKITELFVYQPPKAK